MGDFTHLLLLKSVSSTWASSALKRTIECLNHLIRTDTHLHAYTYSLSATTHLVFMFGAWVTGISFRPAQSPFTQFGLAGVSLLVIKSNLN